MSFINASYFYGNLNIAQKDQKPVADSLQIFIDQYEPEFLERVLGYELWQAFLAGLEESVIDSRWTFLRDGGAFAGYDQRQHKWVGFAAAMSPSSITTVLQPETTVPVGSYAGTNTLTYAPLAGAKYWVERRGFGTMIEGRDITISNGGQTWTLLMSGDQFQPDEVFIAHIQKYPAGAASSGNNYSPVAAYVYYHYMRDLQTQSIGAGEGKATLQNAIATSAAQKMTDAWNIMSKQLCELFEYLNVNRATLYPQWYGCSWSYFSNEFRPINTIGI